MGAFKTRAEGMSSCLDGAGPGVLNAEMVKGIFTAAMKVFEESLRRREAGDEDEDDDDEAELRQSILTVPGAIMKHHPDTFTAEVLPTYLQFVSKLIAQDNDEDRRLVLFAVCDLVEHLGTRVTAQWPSFMP